MDKPVVGFSSSRLLMLDLDNSKDEDVVTVAQYALRRWKLGGYMILKSSNHGKHRDNHHVVFDRYTTWKNVMRMIACLLFKTRNETLRRWTLYQMVKGNCTLRISNKGFKSPPTVISRIGSQDTGIKEYCEFREALGYSV